MRFNVVIPTHRRTALLERTLQSLAAASAPEGFEHIMVVENGEAAGAEAIYEQFAARFPLKYFYYPKPSKGESVQWALDRLGGGFVLFLDDDVRVCQDLLLRYAERARQHGRGHYFGGPLEIDYEVEPAAWLKRSLPNSARGWTMRDPGALLQGKDKFLGANFGAFVEDIAEVGGFSPIIGPGAFHPGSEGNPTGLETELQSRLLAKRYRPVYVEDAIVWHFVPHDRCDETWALHRKYRNGVAIAVRREATRPSRGPWLARVPAYIWLLYFGTVILAASARLVRNPARRFHWIAQFHKLRGTIHAYREVVDR